MTASDPLERHRAYLACRETKKICADTSTWTPEETDVYVRQMVGRIGGVSVGEGH